MAFEICLFNHVHFIHTSGRFRIQFGNRMCVVISNIGAVNEFTLAQFASGEIIPDFAISQKSHYKP